MALEIEVINEMGILHFRIFLLILIVKLKSPYFIPFLITS